MDLAFANYAVVNSMLGQHAPHLGKNICEKFHGGRENVGASGIVAASMPMVVFFLGLTKARTQWLHTVGIVETDKPLPFRVVQGEGVAQSVGAFRRRLHARNLEFEPIAFFEMVDAAIERQQKFKRVFVGYRTPALYIISCDDMINLRRFQGVYFASNFCTAGTPEKRGVVICAKVLKTNIFETFAEEASATTPEASFASQNQSRNLRLVPPLSRRINKTNLRALHTQGPSLLAISSRGARAPAPHQSLARST